MNKVYKCVSTGNVPKIVRLVRFKTKITQMKILSTINKMNSGSACNANTEQVCYF